ncbi:MAG: hypothetical protein IKG56_05560 [Clostridia bacterium]|nr:hypothetical protein [Clostridia bacterium]
MEKDLQFKRNFIWNSLGTGINAFSSLFLLIIVTRINGINEAGIYTIAFSTACILYVIGVYAGRIFQVTETNKEFTDNEFIINRVLTVIVMMICTFGFVTIRHYDFYKSLIFILLAAYKSLEAFSEVIYGIMQKKELLYKVGQSFFIKATLMIIIFFIIDLLTKNLIIACSSMIVVWLVVICTYDFFTIKDSINFKKGIKWKNVFAIFKNGFFVFSITFLGLYVMNAPKYSIDSLMTNDMQTIFGIIVMPASVISLFGQFLIHPYLNKLVNLYSENEYKELKALERKIIIYIIAFGIISSLLAYTLGVPVLQLVYGVDLRGYSIMLTVIIIASTLYNIGLIYSNILTTMRHTFIQFIIYIVTSIIAIITSQMFVKNERIQGATTAYFTIMFFLFVFYTVAERIIIKIERKKYEPIERN